MAAPLNRFFKLSCCGGSERRRWVVEPPWGMDAERVLRQAKPITGWQEMEIAAKPTNVFDDMPWSLDDNFYASDRLREFLEAEAPGHAEFLPVRMVGPGVDAAHARYWAINWLHAHDCLDRARSMTDTPNGPWACAVVIDPAKVPPGVLVTRIASRMVTTIIHSSLARKMKKAGIAGPQFYGVWMSTDDDAPEPIWRPGVVREHKSMPWPQRPEARDA